MKAEFRVRTVWEITGHGPVVIGTIIDGTITAGMVASRMDPAGSGEWCVAGVEFVDHRLRAESQIALRLLDAPALADLRELLPPGSVLTLRA